MPHDVLGLGIVLRLLVQQLDGWHAFALLGRFDAISDANQALSDLKWAKQHQTQAHPARRQDIEIQGLAVKEVKKPVVGIPSQIQYPHKTGHAQVVRATTQADQNQSHPDKGEEALAGRAQTAHRLQPLSP
jgi:hypothetical protein